MENKSELETWHDIGSIPATRSGPRLVIESRHDTKWDNNKQDSQIEFVVIPPIKDNINEKCFHIFRFGVWLVLPWEICRVLITKISNIGLDDCNVAG